MDPSTKPGAGEAPHVEWRNRDYDESDDTVDKKPGRRWMLWVATVISAFMLFGLIWNSIQPLLK